MALRLERPPLWVSLLLAALALALAVYGFFPWARIAAPQLALHETPVAAAPGSPLQRVSGKISGLGNARKFKAVLYARTNQWYVQPFTEQPLTEINADGSFANETHPGAEYALLVVVSDYKPPKTGNALPVSGGQVIAVFSIRSQ